MSRSRGIRTIDPGCRSLRIPATAVLVLGIFLSGSVGAQAKTCTQELAPKDFAGNEANEVICGGVSVRLMPLNTEMYYRRWTGEIAIRSIGAKAQAKVSLAAFDEAGEMVGTWTYYARKINQKPKKVDLRMEGMFISLTDAKKLLVSVSLPSHQPE